MDKNLRDSDRASMFCSGTAHAFVNSFLFWSEESAPQFVKNMFIRNTFNILFLWEYSVFKEENPNLYQGYISMFPSTRKRGLDTIVESTLLHIKQKLISLQWNRSHVIYEIFLSEKRKFALFSKFGTNMIYYYYWNNAGF